MPRGIAHLAAAFLLLAAAPLAAQDNALCPVLTDEAADPAIHAAYQGKEIYFCCEKCRAKFQADPSAYAAQLKTPGITAAAPSAEGDDEEEEAKGLVPFLGRFHVVIVHFPIALLIVAAFSELLAILSRSHRLADFTRFNLTLGAAAAVLAAALGWLDAWGMNPTGERAGILMAHRWLGTGTALLACATFLISWLVCLVPHPRLIHAYRIFVLATAVLVGIAGHFGGRLVFGSGYFSW
jgi:uncharacterized membrane protein/YHS domain-containing protein